MSASGDSRTFRLWVSNNGNASESGSCSLFRRLGPEASWPDHCHEPVRSFILSAPPAFARFASYGSASRIPNLSRSERRLPRRSPQGEGGLLFFEIIRRAPAGYWHDLCIYSPKPSTAGALLRRCHGRSTFSPEETQCGGGFSYVEICTVGTQDLCCVFRRETRIRVRKISQISLWQSIREKAALIGDFPDKTGHQHG
jgi:hypothetical protein